MKNIISSAFVFLLSSFSSANTPNNVGFNWILICCLTFYCSSAWCQNPWQWGITQDTLKNTGSSVSSMVYDNSGNILITGSYGGSITISGNTLQDVGGGDFFIASMTKSGSMNWIKRGGGKTSDAGTAICADKSGNSYVLGIFGSPATSFTVGTTVLTNTFVGGSNTMNSMFLLKYNSSGNLLWAKMIGYGNNCGCSSVGIKDGSLFLYGSFWASTVTPLTIGANTFSIPSNTLNYDVFFAKLDTSGNVLNALTFGGTQDDIAGKLFVTNASEIILSGGFRSTSLVFGTYTLTQPFSLKYSSFLVKMDISGNFLWAKKFTDAGMKAKACSDNSGNIYLASSFDPPGITVDSFTLASSTASATNVMLAKLNSSGTALWAKSIGGTGSSADEQSIDITIDNNGNPYLLGSYYGPTLAIGSYSVFGNGIDISNFIAQFDGNGNVGKAYSATGSYATGIGAGCIITDDNLEVYTAGSFTGRELDLGTIKLYGGNQNYGGVLFIAKAGGVYAGINEISENNSFEVFPNPATSVLNVELNLETSSRQVLNEGSRIKILNMLGEEVLNESLATNHSHLGGQATINIQPLKSGIYFLRLESQTGLRVVKVIKE